MLKAHSCFQLVEKVYSAFKLLVSNGLNLRPYTVVVSELDVLCVEDLFRLHGQAVQVEHIGLTPRVESARFQFLESKIPFKLLVSKLTQPAPLQHGLPLPNTTGKKLVDLASGKAEASNNFNTVIWSVIMLNYLVDFTDGPNRCARPWLRAFGG